MSPAAGQRVHECLAARVHAALFGATGAIVCTVSLHDALAGGVAAADAGWVAVLWVASLVALVLFARSWRWYLCPAHHVVH